MLDDAKHALAAQISAYRMNSTMGEWDVKQATAFQKLVQSLATLQASERANADKLNLGELTPEELARLSAQSTRILTEKQRTMAQIGDSEDD